MGRTTVGFGLLLVSAAAFAETTDPSGTVRTATQANVPPRIPAAVFATRPAYSDLNLYPNGTQVLAIRAAGRGTSIVIHDLVSGKAKFHAYAGEGHGFRDAANFADWLERLDAFLAKYSPAH
jgi:hypothetical protein